MVSFERARDFFWRFLESRNYKIQVVARVGRKSAVVLPGIMEASCSRFFVGLDFKLLALLFSSVSKTITQKPPNTLGMLESTSPRKALHV